MIKDYYKILGIDKNSDALTIKKTYRKLALLYHPDVNKTINANEQFIKITEAYEVLIDQSKRRDYDVLYNKYFVKDTSVVFDYNYASSKSNEWKEYGDKKAHEYANLNINEFLKNVFGEAIYHGKQVSKIGCTAYLWPGVGIIGLIAGIVGIFNGDASEDGPAFVIFMMLIFLIITITGIRHTKKQIREYKQDYRTRKDSRNQ